MIAKESNQRNLSRSDRCTSALIVFFNNNQQAAHFEEGLDDNSTRW